MLTPLKAHASQKQEHLFTSIYVYCILPRLRHVKLVLDGMPSFYDITFNASIYCLSGILSFTAMFVSDMFRVSFKTGSTVFPS